jgi:hypothetical protein
MPRAEQGERAEQDAPQSDQQADLDLLLSVPDDHQEDGDTAEADCTENTQGAKRTSLAWTRSKGRHGASLAIGGRCSVSPLSLFAPT